MYFVLPNLSIDVWVSRRKPHYMYIIFKYTSVYFMYTQSDNILSSTAAATRQCQRAIINAERAIAWITRNTCIYDDAREISAAARAWFKVSHTSCMWNTLTHVHAVRFSCYIYVVMTRGCSAVNLETDTRADCVVMCTSYHIAYRVKSSLQQQIILADPPNTSFCAALVVSEVNEYWHTHTRGMRLNTPANTRTRILPTTTRGDFTSLSSHRRHRPHAIIRTQTKVYNAPLLPLLLVYSYWF